MRKKNPYISALWEHYALNKLAFFLQNGRTDEALIEWESMLTATQDLVYALARPVADALNSNDTNRVEEFQCK